MAFGLFVLLFGWLQNEYYFQKSVEDRLENAEQTRVENKLFEVQLHSVDFQTYAGAFVSSVLDGSETVTENRNTLIQNILAQDAAIDVSTVVFDQQTMDAATRYRSALREMREAVDDTVDVISMGRFWEAASELLVARNKLIAELQRQIRSPNT